MLLQRGTEFCVFILGYINQVQYNDTQQQQYWANQQQWVTNADSNISNQYSQQEATQEQNQQLQNNYWNNAQNEV